MSLEQLRNFTEDEAKRFPSAARHLLIKSPGCTEKEIQELIDFEPNLPPIYVKSISSLRLKGISLPGLFRVWPGGGKVFEGTFAQDFRIANSPGWYQHEKIVEVGLLRVASWNDSDIFVAKKGSRTLEADYVVRFADEGLVGNPITLCDNFEKFLVIAGNIADVLSTRSALAVKSRVEIFMDRLGSFGLTASEVENWEAIASVAFDI